jgi:membrane protease YdiL (CAAX protease family)
MGATLQSQSGPRTVLELVGLTLLTFVIALVAGVVFIGPLIALGYDIESTPILVGATAAGQLGMFGVGYLYYRYRDLSVPVALPSLRELGYATAGVVAAIAAAVVLSVVLTTLELLPSSVIGEAAAMDPTFLLGLAALSIVVVAPVEEFLFRGVIQGRLRDRFGPVPAIAGASLLFGSLHLANYSGNPVAIVAGALMITVVGSIFGILYERTGNLAVPVLVHAIYNTILFGLSYAVLSSA